MIFCWISVTLTQPGGSMEKVMGIGGAQETRLLSAGRIKIAIFIRRRRSMGNEV
jgi:hypothetical protein